MLQKCCDDCKVHYKLAMGGAPEGAMRVASQIWQVVFASLTLQVFCLAFCKKAQYVVVLVAHTLVIQFKDTFAEHFNPHYFGVAM